MSSIATTIRRLTIPSLLLASMVSIGVGGATACRSSSPDKAESAPAPARDAPSVSAREPADALAARQDISNYSKVTESVLAAGQPAPTAWSAISDAGVTTVINLRTEEEGALDEASMVEDAGMRYVHVPVDSTGFDAEKITAIQEAMAQAEGRVMIHCASSNRVGAFWYLHQMAAGANKEAALMEADRAGLRSPNLREQVVALADRLSAQP